jgi:hypothetical protein
MTDNLILPRQDNNGEYYISYSQYDSWRSMQSFNLGVSGKIEYAQNYIFGVQHPDQGWAQFGKEVEDYVCEKINPGTFTTRETDLLDTITPLGLFQQEVKLYIASGVYVKGFLDDLAPDHSKIRDYKTCSKNSSEKYYKPSYYQLDIYALWVQEQKGFIPELEVCAIERKGNCFGMVNRRDLLSVGNDVWYIQRETNQLRLDMVQADLLSTVKEISEMCKIFKQVNK